MKLEKILAIVGVMAFLACIVWLFVEFKPEAIAATLGTLPTFIDSLKKLGAM